MKIRRILLFLFVGLGLSAIIALGTLSHNPAFKKRFEAYCVETLRTGLKCSFSAHLNSVDLLSGSCIFTDVSASDQKDLWRWSAKTARISFSWFDFLLTRLIRTRVTLGGFSAYTSFDQGTFAISEHFDAWGALPPGPIPLVMRSVSVLKGQIVCALSDDPTSCLSFEGTIQTQHKRDVTQVNWALSHGQLSYHGMRLFNNIKGEWHMQLMAPGNCNDVNLEGIGDYLQSKPQCFCSGTWQGDGGEFKLHTHYGAAKVTLVTKDNEILINASLPLDILADLARQQNPELWAGKCDCSLRLGRPAPFSHVTSTWKFNDVRYKQYQLPGGTISLSGDEHALRGSCALVYHDHSMHGSCGWNFDCQKGTIKLVNSKALNIPLLGLVEMNKATIAAEYSAENKLIDGRAHIDVLDPSSKRSRHLTGSLMGNDQHATVKGSYGKDQMSAEFNCGESLWILSRASYRRADHELASILGQKNGSFTGHVRYGLVHDVLSQIVPFSLSGDGDLSVSGRLLDGGVKTKIIFKDGQLLLPHTYNGLSGGTINAFVDYKNNEIRLLDGSHFVLNKGDIDVSKARLLFDHNWQLSFGNLPVTLSNCFVHWKKEMAASISGSLIGTYKIGAKSQVYGKVTVDKGHIQKNVLFLSFGKDFQSGLTKPFINPAWDIGLDIALSSQSSIPVKAPFLTTEVSFKLILTGNIAVPHLHGTIDVLGGTLNFPYQPLYIDHGRVFFSSDQPDPMIELMARNKIQKYHVALTATGSIRQPHVTFESSPTLSEGQIMTLLLGGSADGSLYLAMPVALNQTVEKLLFGSSDSVSAIKNHIATIFKPLKNVRIVPRVGEGKQSGVQGSLMVELNDNLRASVQRNFNAAEESRFEVEYGLTDDMTVRAVKDEHGDVGAEIEKTWKFS